MRILSRFIISILFLMATAPTAQAAGACYELFKLAPKIKNADLRRAVQAGIAVFQSKHLNSDSVMEMTPGSYIHGTSMERIQRSVTADNYGGGPAREFDRLEIDSTDLTIYAYKVTRKKYAILDVSTYAANAADRGYIARHLNIPETSERGGLLSDLADIAAEYTTFRELIKQYKEHPMLSERARALEQVRRLNRKAQIEQVFAATQKRRGVLVIFKPEVKDESRIIPDPELPGTPAYAILNSKGISMKNIEMIIPLSEIERLELEALL